MKMRFPLILVQFLKESMLEELTAMVLVKELVPIPSQTAGRTRPVQVFCLALRFVVVVSVGFFTFGTGSFARFADLDSVLRHLVGSGVAGANTGPLCHHVVVYKHRGTFRLQEKHQIRNLPSKVFLCCRFHM